MAPVAESGADSRPPTLFTVGHSTHPIEQFLSLLRLHQIALLADVRSFPGSRRWPQFNQENLSRSVADSGIEYRWLKRLGGRRHLVRPDSPHTAWIHPAFRSYADYADSEDFAAGLSELIRIAAAQCTAIMCSEGLWWRCHRRIVADRMLLHGWRVMHVMPGGKLSEHVLPGFARRAGARLIYDGAPATGNLK